MRRQAYAYATLAALGILTVGCGAGEHRGGHAPVRAASATRPERPPGQVAGMSNRPPHGRLTDRDGDGDHNDDDYDVTGYGHAATAADRRAISTLIDDYHSATAAGAGTRTCTLLNATLAASLAAQPASAGTTGTTGACGRAVEAMLKHLAGRTDAGIATVRVTLVRVKGTEAFALVRLPGGEERYTPVELEQGAWKIGTLFDLEMI